MSRFKTFAVVCEETDEVIGQFLEDMKFGQQVKKNGLSLRIEDGEDLSTKTVRLSSNQKDIAKITSVFDPQQCHRNIYGRGVSDLIQVFN